MSSDASASTDSNTYYEDDFSSTEEDSSQGRHPRPLPGPRAEQAAPLGFRSPPSLTGPAWILPACALKGDLVLKSEWRLKTE